MGHHVGITTNPEERKKYWTEKDPAIRNWKILGKFNSKSEAQFAQSRYAREMESAVYSGGGGSEEGIWYVYSFESEGIGETIIEFHDAEGLVCIFDSLQQVQKFLEDEIDFWAKQREKVGESRNSRVNQYLKSAARLAICDRDVGKFAEAMPALSDEKLQHAIEGLRVTINNQLQDAWIWSKRPYVESYVKCHSLYGMAAAGVFIKCVLGKEFSVGNRASFLGAMLGYEFIPQQGENADIRHRGEKKSFDDLRIQSHDRIVKFAGQADKCISDFEQWYEEVRGKSDEQYESIKDRHENQHQAQSKSFAESHKGWGKRVEDLESLYAEKLRLEKPAKYWKDAAEKYKRQGIRWTRGTVAFSVVGLAGLGISFYLWLNGYSAQLKLDTLQGAVIFASVMAVFAFVLRVLARLSFSAFHLMRDAEEREQLTYLYLSLSRTVPQEKESQGIILRALFSRSQTGLLTNERGPTMPGDLTKRDE